jgi:polyisoprenoid-binding protein YceI
MMTHRSLFALLLLVLPASWSAAQTPANPPPPPEVSAKAASLPAGHYKLDPKHGSVLAVVRHLGVSDYVMRFDKFDADFTYDPAQPQATHLEASVDATSLDVGADYSKQFADQFLGAAKFPKATFVSTAMAPNPGGRTGTMTGDLTLNGVTRPVTFVVTFLAVGHGVPFGTIAGFTAEGTIRRSDFGSRAFLKYVSDEVRLQIRGEFDKK